MHIVLDIASEVLKLNISRYTGIEKIPTADPIK